MNGIKISILVALAACLTFLGLMDILYAVGFFCVLAAMFTAVRWPYAFFMLIFFVFEKFFETIDFGLDYWMFGDFTLILLMGGLFVQLLQAFRCRRSFLPNKEEYFLFILGLWVITLFAMIHGSYFVLGQPIKSLIFRPRWFLLLFVFVFMYNANFTFEHVKRFYKFLIWSAVVVAVCIIIDAKLLGGGKIFAMAMGNGVSGTRSGSVRLSAYVTPSVWALYYLMSILKFKGNPKTDRWVLAGIGLILVQFFTCNMTRQLMVSISLTIMIYCAGLPARFRRWFFALAGVFVFTLVLFMYLTGGQSGGSSLNIIEQTQEELSVNKGGNINVRKDGIAYYHEYLKKTNYLGIGITSTTLPNSPEFEGGEEQYLMADIGLFAVFFRFGIFGLLLVAVLFYVMFRDARFIIKHGNIDQRAIAGGIFYFLVGQVVLLPSSNIFFPEYETLHVGMLFYFITVMKRDCNKAIASQAQELTHASTR